MAEKDLPVDVRIDAEQVLGSKPQKHAQFLPHPLGAAQGLPVAAEVLPGGPVEGVVVQLPHPDALGLQFRQHRLLRLETGGCAAACATRSEACRKRRHWRHIKTTRQSSSCWVYPPHITPYWTNWRNSTASGTTYPN